MILGRPTTRAIFARILVGIAVAVGLSVAFLAVPARAEVARAGAVPLAFVRPAPGPSVPAVKPVPAAPNGQSPPPKLEQDEIIRPDSSSGAQAPQSDRPSEEQPTPALPSTLPPSLGLPPSGLSPAVRPAAPVVAAPAAPPAGLASGPLDVVMVLPSAAPVRRPRFDVAVGMGGSFDGSGLVKGRTVLAPAFLVQAGIGDGPVGFAVRLQSTQASGRFHQTCNGVSDMAVDRLAIDLLFALRPFASKGREDPRWIARFARAAAIDVGASGENASLGSQAAFRIGIVAGAHIDLPLTAPGDATELRARLGVRRMMGGQGVAGPVTVSDTTVDLSGGLAIVF